MVEFSHDAYFLEEMGMGLFSDFFGTDCFDCDQLGVVAF